MNSFATVRLATLALVSAICHAAPTDTFEVASIRPNRNGGSNTQISLPPGGRLVVVNATLKTLIRNAYGLLSFQFAGAPGWFDDDKFDINAKTDSPEKITPDRLKPLLQNLLSDRFSLKVHWETQVAPVYELITDKNGPKFQTSAGGTEQGMNTSKGPGKARMKGRDVPMAELASNLASQLGRFVVDQTGLPEHYDFVLEWDPDQSADTIGPSIFTALREQLGLRLEPRKGLVQVLVIDNAEKPSRN